MDNIVKRTLNGGIMSKEQELDTQVEESAKTESENVVTDENKDTQHEEKRFTQTELDEIRLQREKDKQRRLEEERESELEQRRLEEQGEYKELLEQVKAENEKLKQEKADAERKALIGSKLAEKGFDSSSIDRHIFYVDSLISSGKEVDEAVEQVANDFKVAQQQSYANPSSSLGETSVKAEPKDKEELGREAFRRLRG